jgi:prepilin-type N-terminal cleavage/methylation domain-containing protein
MAPYNKKGFSLAELLAVMAIIAVMAAVSTFYVRDYIKDAANDKAKVAMQVAAQAYKNFKADYPRASLKGKINGLMEGAKCENVIRTSDKGDNKPAILYACNYLRGVNFEGHKYDFYAGPGQCTGAPTTSLACMVGTGSDVKYGSGYSAWVTNFGQICERGSTCS